MITPTVSGMGDTGLSHQSKSLIQSVSMKVRWTNGKKPCTMQSVEYQRSAHYHNKWVRCVVCLGRIVFRLPVCEAGRANVLDWFNHYLFACYTGQCIVSIRLPARVDYIATCTLYRTKQLFKAKIVPVIAR